MQWDSIFLGEPTGATNDIPKVIYQTYHTKELIPRKVEENFNKYAPQFQRYVYNDAECTEFIKQHFQAAVVELYNLLEGPHRADLFRYAIMYIHGGVYIDIKTELMTPLIVTIPIESDRRKEGSRGVTYSVIALHDRRLYQGFIASPPGNPIFLRLIFDFVLIAKPVEDYQISTKKFYQLISDATQESVSPEIEKPFLLGGMNSVRTEGEKFDYYLLTEINRPLAECYDGADRYGFCCFIYREGAKHMKVRYSDYPWEINKKQDNI